MTVTRRHLLRGGSAAMLVGASAIAGRVQAASIPEAPTRDGPATAPPPLPASGPPFRPVVTLNGWSLPWRMKDGWKEFLSCRGIRRSGDGFGCCLFNLCQAVLNSLLLLNH